MANIALGAAKRVYIPAAKKKVQPSAPRLAFELARMSATQAMRTVAWEGAAATPEAVAPTSNVPASTLRIAGLSPLMSAREAFSRIPWNGEKPSDEQTGEQLKRSVKAVLDAFKWE